MAVIEDWKKLLQSIFFCCHLGGNISSLWHFLRLPWHLLVIRKRREMWGRGTSMESSSQCQDANCCFENWNSKNGPKQQTSRKHPVARTADILFLVKHKFFSGWGSVEGMSNLPFSKEYFELKEWGKAYSKSQRLSCLEGNASESHIMSGIPWREQDTPYKQDINKRTPAKGQ